MENNLELTIDNFLNSKFYSRALLINGDWGVGKTFFIKNVFRDYLKKKGFELLYLTVNGMNSVADVKKMILTKAILKTDEDARDKVFSKIKSRFQKLISKSSKVEAFFEILDLGDLIKLENLVVCFDDLERLSSTLKIEDFLGFINSELIEHKNVKVVLVGNQTKNNLSTVEFGAINEKYIGWSFKYEPDLAEIFSALMSNYQSESVYFQFLEMKKLIIQEIVIAFEINNIRTLQFFFEIIKLIQKELSEEYENIYDDVIYFALIICHEFKEGNLHPHIDNNVIPACIANEDKGTFVSIDLYSESQEVEPSSEEINRDKYCEHFRTYSAYSRFVMYVNRYNIKYTFFKPIYNLITKGYFDKEELKSNFEIHSKNKAPSIKYKENDSISKIINFYDLNESEYDDNIQLVINNLRSGGFNIFELVHALNNLLAASKIKMINYSENDLIELATQSIGIINLENLKIEELFDTIGIERFLYQLEVKSPNLTKLVRTKLEEVSKERLLRKNTVKLTVPDSILDDDLLLFLLEELKSDRVIQFLNMKLKDRLFLENLNRTFRMIFPQRINKVNCEKVEQSLTEIYNNLKEKVIKNVFDKIDKYYLNDLLETISTSKKDCMNIKSIIDSTNNSNQNIFKTATAEFKSEEE